MAIKRFKEAERRIGLAEYDRSSIDMQECGVSGQYASMHLESDQVKPNHVQVTSSLQHKINQTFRLSVEKEKFVLGLQAGMKVWVQG